VYGMPQEIAVVGDGALRIVTLNRPQVGNAVNGAMQRGLARLWPRLSDDPEVRAVILTGAGGSFSEGSDDGYISQLERSNDFRYRAIDDGRQLVLGMARCRVPILAAVNGPTMGLGCSLVTLSDIVYIAPGAYLSYPGIDDELRAAAGNLITWPLHINVALAKEYALTGAPTPARRAVELGLVNHVANDPLGAARHCADAIMAQPAHIVEQTRRLLNQPIERAVLSALD
jgi:enoyl-CoA hydratase